MRFKVKCKDKIGIAEKLFRVFAENDLNVIGIDFKSQSTFIYVHILDINFETLQKVMYEVRTISGVEDVVVTSYMPSEKDNKELSLIKSVLKVPHISVDDKLIISSLSELWSYGIKPEGYIGKPVSELVKGFDFTKWRAGCAKRNFNLDLNIGDLTFESNIKPIFVSNSDGEAQFSGALIIINGKPSINSTNNLDKRRENLKFSEMVAKSAVMKKLLREAKHYALCDAPLMIYGEEGVGKETIAKAIHDYENRSGRPFVKVHGAEFAVSDKQYKVLNAALSKARNGTLYIESIEDMPLYVQAKILTIVKGAKVCDADWHEHNEGRAKLIFSTRQRSFEEVRNSSVRKDLLFEIHANNLYIPALRKRSGQDFITIINHLVKSISLNLNKPTPKISPKCVQTILSYPWPGNISQLKSVLTKALTFSEKNVLSHTDLGLPDFCPDNGFLSEENARSFRDLMKAYEEEIMRKLYPAFPSSRLLAKRLGISHTAVANKLKQYDICVD